MAPTSPHIEIKKKFKIVFRSKKTTELIKVSLDRPLIVIIGLHMPVPALVSIPSITMTRTGLPASKSLPKMESNGPANNPGSVLAFPSCSPWPFLFN